MVVCEGLLLATQHDYFILEVESDSATVVFLINSDGLVRWDYSYSLRRVRALSSLFTILVRHVLQDTTFATDFLAN